MTYPDYPLREKERLIHEAVLRELVESFKEPISEELEAFLAKVKRVQLEDALKESPRMKQSWRIVYRSGRMEVEDYVREAEDWEVI